MRVITEPSARQQLEEIRAARHPEADIEVPELSQIKVGPAESAPEFAENELKKRFQSTAPGSHWAFWWPPTFYSAVNIYFRHLNPGPAVSAPGTKTKKGGRDGRPATFIPFGNSARPFGRRLAVGPSNKLQRLPHVRRRESAKSCRRPSRTVYNPVHETCTLIRREPPPDIAGPRDCRN